MTIAITGIGLITPFGCSPDALWQYLQSNDPPLFTTGHMDLYPFPSKLAGGLASYSLGDAPPALLKIANRYCQLAALAAQDALSNSEVLQHISTDDIGVIGSTQLGLPGIEQLGATISPLKAQFLYLHSATGLIAIQHHLHGPSWTVATGEASGLMALSQAVRWLRAKKCKAILVGGADTLSRSAGLHFASLGALSPCKGGKRECCEPFGINRNGTILSEGSVWMVLEPYDQAVHRQAPIHGLIEEGVSFQVPTTEKGVLNPFDPQGTPAFPFASACNALGYVMSAANGSPTVDAWEHAFLTQSVGDAVPVVNLTHKVGNMMGTGGLVNVVAGLLMARHRTLLGFPPYERLPGIQYAACNTPVTSDRFVAQSIAHQGTVAALLASGYWSVADTVQALSQRLNRQMLPELPFIAQYTIAEEGVEHAWYIAADEQGVSVVAGCHPAPTIQMAMSYATWMAIIRDEKTGQQAFFEGDLMADGDFSLLANHDLLYSETQPA